MRALCAAAAVLLLSAMAGFGSSSGSPAERQAALIAALVDLAEASYRAGRLDEALRVLDGGAALVTRSQARARDLVRLDLQRAKSVYYQASLAGRTYEPAIASLRAVLDDAEDAGDRALVADAQDLLGLALYSRSFRESAHDEARALFESALATRRSLGDRRGASETLFHLGLTRQHRKDPTPEDVSAARRLFEQALALAEGEGFEIEASYAYRHLAALREDAHDLDGALHYFEKSLRLREAAGYEIYLPPALLALGDVWREKGERARARELYSRALDEAERMGAARFVAGAREALAGLNRDAAR